MPRKKFYRKKRKLFKSKKRFGKKLSKANYKGNTLYKSPGLLLSDTLKMKFKWDGHAALSVASPAVSLYYWIRANSLYQPDPTPWFNLNQPTGVLDLATFYERYTVTGCKIKYNFQNTTGVSYAVVILPTNNVTQTELVVQTLEEARSQRYAKTKMVSIAGGQDKASISMYMPTHKIVGSTRTKILDDDTYAGLLGNDETTPEGGSPNNIWYWFVWIENLSGNVGGEGAGIFMNTQIELTFYATLFERKGVRDSALNTEPGVNKSSIVSPQIVGPRGKNRVL